MAQPRILIANRGEIAVRIMRTCRELGLHTIAVYSDADRDALHVQMADSAYRIGPAVATESYLAIGQLLDAAQRGKATMVHPGYGFLAERAQFARAVQDFGATFVGPSPESIDTMGDKSAARAAAERSGVPIVPGTPEPVTIGEAGSLAKDIGFPLVVKAAFGGGGKGMHVVRSPERLDEGLRRAEREALAYFGRSEVFLERYVERARHVEAQVMVDTHGNAFFLGERDCSVQRRHQKLIEETPSPVVDEDLRSRLGEAALALAKASGYTNAGTVECIVDEDGSFYFLEMNTRLQVEHTVTEMVGGLDLVALQIAVAMGERLDLDFAPRGHAIQARVNAEDPGRNFLPGPGRITRYREPSGPFVRVDSGVVQGMDIPGDYDSMFAKLVVWGENRDEACRRMLRALAEFRIEGVPTTIPMHAWILDSADFRNSAHTTTWLERALIDADLPAQSNLLPAGTNPSAGNAHPEDILVEVDGRRVPVRIFDERRDTPPRPPSEREGHHGEHVQGVISAPMQGTILRVLVEPGQRVEPGDVVCVLEAMKMENSIVSPREGEVSELPVEPGQVVQTGQTLAVID